MSDGLTYRGAGVDVDAGNRAVELMRRHVAGTQRPGVLGGFGGFGGLFELDLSRYPQPVLVSGTDGVGTKLRIAFLMEKHDTIGQDAVAMCANDVVAQGAEPLFFLDYLAVGKLNPQRVAGIVAGVSAGCRLAGCALIGGETAEMPGFYPPDEYDIAGFCVGVVNKPEIIDGSRVAPGDALIGLASSGLHSNGYSLVRRLFLDRLSWSLDRHVDELGRTLGEELLEPTRIYARTVLALRAAGVDLKGVAHITGGGLMENVPRVLPQGTKAVLQKASWTEPPVFDLIRRLGPVEDAELARAFNLGVGMVLVVPAEQADEALRLAREAGETAWQIGEVRAVEGSDAGRHGGGKGAGGGLIDIHLPDGGVLR